MGYVTALRVCVEERQCVAASDDHARFAGGVSAVENSSVECVVDDRTHAPDTSANLLIRGGRWNQCHVCRGYGDLHR